MPQPSFHLMLAESVLDSWREAPVHAPFPAADARNRIAFLHGAIGPDMGFFPGVPRRLSEFAHRTRTGDLTREILRQAETTVQAAFAYGWATHVLADALVHPLVNDTAASMVAKDTTPSRGELQSLHVRLEIGLDLLVHRKDPLLRRTRLASVFDRGELRFLSRALETVHGVEVSPDLLAGGHRRIAQLCGPLLTLQAAMSECVPPTLASVPFVQSVRFGIDTVCNVVSLVHGEHAQAVAFLSPLPIPEAVVTGIDWAINSFRGEFAYHAAHRLSTFPNYNLDTGDLEDVEAEAPAVA